MKFENICKEFYGLCAVAKEHFLQLRRKER